MSARIYLDNNASTYLDPRISEELGKVLESLGANPSSVHLSGQAIRNLINKARYTVASFLKVKPNEILFTSGGTESSNMIIHGILHNSAKGHVITSSTEHACVHSTIKQFESLGFEVSFLNAGEWGAVSPESVLAAIRPNTQLIALMAVNNETGVKTDIAAIADIAARHAIPFFVDAVALLGKELFDIPPGVGAMSFSGHKLHTLQGTGVAFIRSGLKLKPLLYGGEQEFGRRAGTENVLGIAGFAKAIELLKEELPHASLRMERLRDSFERHLIEALPRIAINGRGPRVVNVSNVAFPGVDGETLLIGLDQAGVSASHGSACSSGALEPSRILLSMGIPLDLVRSSLRFSLSRFTTEEEIEAACAIITRLVKRFQAS